MPQTIPTLRCPDGHEFTLDEFGTDMDGKRVSDIKFCPFCGTRMKYD